MQTTANITRFITGNSSRSGFADLKRLISSKETFQHTILNELIHAENSKKIFENLAKRFVSFAEQAYVYRNLSALEEARLGLSSLPLPEAQQIGIYYQSVINYHSGKMDEALAQAESIIDTAPLGYRARAFLMLGSIYHVKGNIDESFRPRLEAIRAALHEKEQGLLNIIKSEQDISYILSDLGDHHRALSKLESLWPLIRVAAKQQPFHFYLYHNELAVELAEVGRFDEAQVASDIALASPFASAYPEWSETREEIAQKRGSKWSNLLAWSEPLLATELNSISNQDSQTATDSKIEVESEPQTEQVRAVKYQRAVILNFSIRKYNFQIPSVSVFAKSAAVNLEYAQSIVERLGESVRPRSPPCFS